MAFICYNGSFVDERKPVLFADNRGYRYGDGFFETIKLVNGKIPLLNYHVERIEASIVLLQYQQPETTIESIFEQIFELCKMNHCEDKARVRLSFSNGNGSALANNNTLNYLIEVIPLDENFNYFNTDGFVTGTCPAIKKSCDQYSNLKSANYLPSLVAIDFAKRNGWNDAFIINQHNNIIESSVANLFWIKDGRIYTPSLSEGCVRGVMRAYLIEKLLSENPVVETYCTTTDLLKADEAFLTNAINGIRWVKHFENKLYDCIVSRKIYEEFVAPLWLAS